MLPDLRWGKTPEELARSMLQPESFAQTEQMAAGSHFESAIGSWLGLLCGLTIEPDGFLYASDSAPWMGASPDGRLGLPTGDPASFDCTMTLRDPWGAVLHADAAVSYLRALPAETLVELKQSRSRGRPRWRADSPPDYYVNQVQHQMHVLGVDSCVLMAKVDAFEMWGYHIEMERGYCDLLEKATESFWREHIEGAP